MKQELITPKQFVDMPLSQAVRQVIYDAKQLDKKGVCFNMGIWSTKGISGKVCQVCLGTAALVSFEGITNEDYPGEDKAGCTIKEWNTILLTFNEIRRIGYDNALSYWYPFANLSLNSDISLMKKHHKCYSNKMSAADMKQLYKQMNEFANVLEKHGR